MNPGFSEVLDFMKFWVVSRSSINRGFTVISGNESYEFAFFRAKWQVVDLKWFLQLFIGWKNPNLSKDDKNCRPKVAQLLVYIRTSIPWDKKLDLLLVGMKWPFPHWPVPLSIWLRWRPRAKCPRPVVDGCWMVGGLVIGRLQRPIDCAAGCRTAALHWAVSCIQNQVRTRAVVWGLLSCKLLARCRYYKWWEAMSWGSFLSSCKAGSVTNPVYQHI